MWRVIFSIFVATTLVGATPSDEEEKKDTIQHYADQSLFSGPRNEEAPRQEALQPMETTPDAPPRDYHNDDEVQEYADRLASAADGSNLGNVINLVTRGARQVFRPIKNVVRAVKCKRRPSSCNEDEPDPKHPRVDAGDDVEVLGAHGGPHGEAATATVPKTEVILLDANGGQHETVSASSGAEHVPMVVDANGVQHATTTSCTDDPVAILSDWDKYPIFKDYLQQFLAEDYQVRRGKLTVEKVWRASFEDSQLVELCKGAQRGGHEFVDALFLMGKERTRGEKRGYVVYAVSSTIVFETSEAHDNFLEEFKRLRPLDAYLFDEVLPYNIEGYEGYTYIRIFGIGEGWDVQRASHYRYFPKGWPELTTGQEKRLRSSLIKSVHWIAAKADGVHWRECPATRKNLVVVHTIKSYGREPRKMAGLSTEGVLIVAVQVFSQGIVPFNKQIGCRQDYMFRAVYQSWDKTKSVGGDGYTYQGRCYSRVDAMDIGEDDEPEVCIEDPDFTLRFEPQMMEMLISACGDLPIEYEDIEAVVDASNSLLFRFTVIEYASALIEDGRRTLGETEAPFDLFVDPERLARVRVATGLPPSESYVVILSDEAKPFRDALVAADVLVEDYSMLDPADVDTEHRCLVSEANRPEFVKATGLTGDEAARGAELIALMRREIPGHGFASAMDRFLDELVSRWVASDKKMYLLEDARMLAAARHAAGAWPYEYEWLLGDGELAKQIRDTLAELGLFCGKPANPHAINNAYVDIVREANPLKLAEALEGRVKKEAIEGVRVAVKDAGWTYGGLRGIECVFVELVERCGKPCEEGILASAPRLAEARNACPNFQDVGWLRALLEPYDERGIAVRAAMEEAGLVRDVASVVVFDVQGTWTHEACVEADFEADKCAATVADVREMVRGMRAKDVQWSFFDRIMAAAIPLAKEEGGHLFKAEILAKAIKSLERPQVSHFYPFLVLLNKKDPTAVAVREKLDGLHAGEAYTLATETAVRELVKPPNPPPKFYLAAQEVGFKDMVVEKANKVLEHYRTMTGRTNAIPFDTFLANLVRLADDGRGDGATGPLDLFASAEKVAEASKGKDLKPSETFKPYLRGLDFLDKKSDDSGSAFSKFEAAYSETNAWKKLPRRGSNWRKKLETKLKKEATAALEIQKLLIRLGLERAGSTRTTWAAAHDAYYQDATASS